jgi:uroporphyrinogen decarboxylase
MNSRERVMATLNFQSTDRVPCDLAGMRSTGISCFAYPNLVAALGLPPRRPKVYDTGQMLALPDRDVLDALGIDVITVEGTLTNAFEQPERWDPYDFNGRLDALVPKGIDWKVQPDGTIVQNGDSLMPPGAHVFDVEHAGQPLVLNGDLPRPDLAAMRAGAAAQAFTPTQIDEIRAVVQRVRRGTDRAVFFAHGKLYGNLGICACGGMGVFPILCLTEPDLVAGLHEIVTQRVLANLQALLPAIAGDIDVLLLCADDWGMQNGLIAPPWVYRDLFQPFLRRINDEAHRLAPHVKTFLHCCGAIYEALDIVADSGFDIVNPVQWSAGGRTPEEWKARAASRRLALWGGGVDSQHTLPLGTVADVERQVREVVPVLASGGGYVFCNIHNILAEIAPEKVMAMYRTAKATSRGVVGLPQGCVVR